MENRHSLGFSRQERLLSKEDFLRMKKIGSQKNGRSVIYVSCQNQLSQPRLGCIVTRKTGNAIVRNKWKRTVREFFRNHKSLFQDQKDHLWIIKPSFKGKPHHRIGEEMKELLQRSSK